MSLRSLNGEASVVDDVQIDVEDRVQRVGDRGKLAHRQVGAARLDVRDVRRSGPQSLSKLRLGETGVMAGLADRLPDKLGGRIGACRARHQEPLCTRWRTMSRSPASSGVG